MYDIASNKVKKNRLIQDIVEEKDKDNLIRNYENSCVNNKSTLQNNIDDLFKLQTDIDELTSNLKEKGDKSGLEKEIDNLQVKISDSHQGEDFSEGELKEFETLKKEIVELEQLQNTLENDKNEIAILEETGLFDASFSYKLNQLSELNTKAVQELFDSIKQSANEQWKAGLTKKLTEIDTIIETHKNDIKNKKNLVYSKKEAPTLNKISNTKSLTTDSPLRIKN